MGEEKTRGATGIGRDAAAARDPFTREVRAAVRQKTQPNIANATIAKPAMDAATDFGGGGRVNTWPVPGCGGGDDIPIVKSTSTCVSSLRPASVSICETIQRASCRLSISSARVYLRPFFVRRRIA